MSSRFVEEAAKRRTQLRFFTCGSVDDGKSTLIGRLLYDTNNIAEDQWAALLRDSARHGTAGSDPDFALLTDGLEDEKEQGITIDVAFRYFSTPLRTFVVADTPGHEQYTRNMATGASTAQLAVLLVDARKGLLPQTCRHAVITSTMGIRHVVLAVNKLDLVAWNGAIFDKIVQNFREFGEKLGFESVVAIPISARYGDNVTTKSANTPWYAGPTLLNHLEAIDIATDRTAKPFRLPVQNVLRGEDGGRFYAGTLESGLLSRGEAIGVASTGSVSSVREIYVSGESRHSAQAGQAVAVALADELDVGRGDLLAPPAAMPHVADQFAAHLVWMNEEELLPGRPYLMKIGARTVPASVTSIKYRLAIDTLEQLAARTLKLNEIGVCNIATAIPVAVDHFTEVPATGGFILIDRFTNSTLAAGTIDFALRRGENIHPQQLDVSQRTRASLKGQRPAILWFTGLSGAGKSSIANRLEVKLSNAGRHSCLLDGDNLRSGLNRDLGFSDVDRVENIRRVGEVAKLFVDAGILVLCAFISPFRNERDAIRGLVGPNEFVEILVDAPLEICEARDSKGLYAKSRSGNLPNFTGVDSPYERPENPELVLDSVGMTADELAERVFAYLSMRGYLESTDEIA
jgi:bifunctional enzyme CysN/CysC